MVVFPNRTITQVFLCLGIVLYLSTICMVFKQKYILAHKESLIRADDLDWMLNKFRESFVFSEWFLSFKVHLIELNYMELNHNILDHLDILDWIWGWLYEAGWPGAGSFSTRLQLAFHIIAICFYYWISAIAGLSLKIDVPLNEPAPGQPASYNQPLSWSRVFDFCQWWPPPRLAMRY